jgi:cytosine/adenosine deaminase-related metal-dependent hydrolase
MNMPSVMLLKGGTVLVHDVIDSVKAIHADLLIEGNKIKKITAGITAPADAIVIDCSDKILSPGFIDTHHHVWNTQLRGRHANQLVLEYAYAGQSGLDCLMKMEQRADSDCLRRNRAEFELYARGHLLGAAGRLLGDA